MEALSMGTACAPLFLVSLSSLPKPSLPSGENAHLSRGHPGHGRAGLPHVFSSRESRLHPGGPQGPEKSPDQGSEASAAPTSFASLQPRGRGEDVASASAELAGGAAPACPVERMEWSGWRHRSASQTRPGLPSGPSFHEFPLISAVARPLPSWPHLEGLQGGPPRPPGCPLGDGHSLGV